MQGKSKEMVRQLTEQRDFVIQEWVDGVNAESELREQPPRVHYAVFSDCHSLGYQERDLDVYFSTDPQLGALESPYLIAERHCFKSPSDFEKAVAPDSQFEGYTFVLKADVDCGLPRGGDGNEKIRPLVGYFPDGNGYDNQRLVNAGTVVLTEDYYRWLKANYPEFKLLGLHWILFFKHDHVLGTVYDRIVKLRAKTDKPVYVSWFKRLINLASGYLGVRSSGQRAAVTKVVKELPANTKPFLIDYDFQHVTSVGSDSYHTFTFRSFPSPHQPLRPAQNNVAAFLFIVERGKLRLLECLRFLDQSLDPRTWTHAYTNIDNALVLLAGGAKSLEEAVANSGDPSKIAFFQRYKEDFLYEKCDGPVKPPGHLEIEWTVSVEENGPFKFLTTMVQHYALLCEKLRDSRHKAAGWSGLDTEETYEKALQLFRGQPVTIPQVRRVDKRAGMATKTVDMTFQGKQKTDAKDQRRPFDDHPQDVDELRPEESMDDTGV